MVVASGVYPYSYHTSSWNGAESGRFRIPAGQFVQPSAVHFEETMYVSKAEHNRVVNKTSGYLSSASAPSWFTLFNGRFYNAISSGQSGVFEPQPLGQNLGGQNPILFFSNVNNFVGKVPGAVHQQIYITQLRQLGNTIFGGYGDKGGGWAIEGSAELATSGARRDWLTVYKGYNDAWANSGLYYQDTEAFSSGLLFDRYLDEVRLQPMPFFGVANDLSVADFDHKSPWGIYNKFYNFGFPPLRPRYMMTNGNLPSGWASGLQIGLKTDEAGGQALSGIGGHLISGICITLSGGGDGKQSHMRLVSGVYGGPLYNDSYPSSPSYISLTSLTPSGASTIPSGQYRVMLTKEQPDASFPWGASGSNIHKSAVWPWDNYYEPYSGVYADTLEDFFNTTAENSSFWVTDHVFAYQHAHGGTQNTPRLSSGIYWYQLNAGPSKHAALLDGWTMNHYPSGLWGLVHEDEVDVTDTSSIPQRIAGCSWAYDRANNYYVKIGHSGAVPVTSSNECSGVYERYNQQMAQVTNTTAIAGTTINGVPWSLSKAYNMAWNGSNWVVNGVLVSGLYNTSYTAGARTAWARLDSSFAIVDGVLYSGGTLLGWLHYARGTSEYLALTNNASADDYHGVAGSKYNVVSSITWGDLQNADSAGSGSYTTTQYTMSYSTGMENVINLATATAQNRVHIMEFFDTEPDNNLFCVVVGFVAGSASGTGNTPSVFVCSVSTAGGHPYTITSGWRMHSLGTTYANFTAGGGLTTIDGCPDSMDHMEIHVNG